MSEQKSEVTIPEPTRIGEVQNRVPGKGIILIKIILIHNLTYLIIQNSIGKFGNLGAKKEVRHIQHNSSPKL